MLQSLIRGSNKFYRCTIKIPQPPPPPPNKKVVRYSRPFFWYIDKYILIFGFYVVYTKTIIHLSVGESGGYLPPLR